MVSMECSFSMQPWAVGLWMGGQLAQVLCLTLLSDP